MTKFKKELFYSADTWLTDSESDLLKDSETYYLMVEAKNARVALEERLAQVMGDASCY
jgi:hypothetical protein